MEAENVVSLTDRLVGRALDETDALFLRPNGRESDEEFIERVGEVIATLIPESTDPRTTSDPQTKSPHRLALVCSPRRD